MNQATLLFLKDGNRILLAMKKRGFGAGRWNGVGGKPDKGETVNQAAVRECWEEVGVTPAEMKKSAILNFYFPGNKEKFNQQVIVFMCTSWRGEPTETEEMSPKWFDIGDIPYTKMWSDDKYWLPRVIDGEYLEADFHFDNNDGLLDYKIKS
ncbi:MAG TPA: 8-oxo-dGTP diphosphatase [Candidatus Saccharimonadales bacterium]|jgi:mutator protein MutT|nr:8-oxo-dGTP diphosphatase [Candidatus Saccharimonadales bacterium]